jgi:hypothetical protein
MPQRKGKRAPRPRRRPSQATQLIWRLHIHLTDRKWTERTGPDIVHGVANVLTVRLFGR